MGARRVVHGIDPPGVSSCRRTGRKHKKKKKTKRMMAERNEENPARFLAHLEFLAAKLYAAASPAGPHTEVR